MRGTPATVHAYQDNRMSDSNGSPQPDDRHHRRSHSRSVLDYEFS